MSKPLIPKGLFVPEIKSPPFLPHAVYNPSLRSDVISSNYSHEFIVRIFKLRGVGPRFEESVEQSN